MGLLKGSPTMIVETNWNLTKEIVPTITNVRELAPLVPLRYYVEDAANVAVIKWSQNKKVVNCILLLGEDKAKVNAGKSESSILSIFENYDIGFPPEKDDFCLFDLVNKWIIYCSWRPDLLEENKHKIFIPTSPTEESGNTFVLGSNGNFGRMSLGLDGRMVNLAFLISQAKYNLKSPSDQSITDFGLKFFVYLMCKTYGIKPPPWDDVKDMKPFLNPLQDSFRLLPNQIERLEDVWAWGAGQQEEWNQNQGKEKEESEGEEVEVIGRGVIKVGDVLIEGDDDFFPVGFTIEGGSVSLEDIILSGIVPFTRLQTEVNMGNAISGVIRMYINFGFLYIHINPDIITKENIIAFLDVPDDKICVIEEYPPSDYEDDDDEDLNQRVVFRR